MKACTRITMVTVMVTATAMQPLRMVTVMRLQRMVKRRLLLQQPRLRLPHTVAKPSTSLAFL